MQVAKMYTIHITQKMILISLKQNGKGYIKNLHLKQTFQ